MRFSNKQALIVGGGSGMGLETGRLLVETGASVTLVGRRQEKLDDARESFDTPDNVRTFQCDLTSKEDVDRLIRYIAEEMKDVKYLINAAGVFSPKAFLDHTEGDYDAYMDLNRATFFVTQQVTKNMVANGGGSVVNVGSMWAHQAIKATPSSAYSMAKSGLHSLTQHLAMELAAMAFASTRWRPLSWKPRSTARSSNPTRFTRPSKASTLFTQSDESESPLMWHRWSFFSFRTMPVR